MAISDSAHVFSDKFERRMSRLIAHTKTLFQNDKYYHPKNHMYSNYNCNWCFGSRNKCKSRPFMERGFNDDWGLSYPTGQSDETFLAVIQEIERKVLDLREKLL